MTAPVFIEIGTSDFDNLDGLLDEGWRGFFVEPIKEYLDSLKKKVQSEGRDAHFLNVAVSDNNGYSLMTYVDPSSAKEQWIRGISHMNSESSNLIVRNDVNGYDMGDVKNIYVPTVTLDWLLKFIDVKNVHMLRIDVEGHELAILRNYSWNIKPKCIKIEHKFVDKMELLQLLVSKGYIVLDEGDDFYCVYNGDMNERIPLG